MIRSYTIGVCFKLSLFMVAFAVPSSLGLPSPGMKPARACKSQLLTPVNQARAAITMLMTVVEALFETRFPENTLSSPAALRTLLSPLNLRSGLDKAALRDLNALTTFALQIKTLSDDESVASGLPNDMNITDAKQIALAIVTAMVALDAQNRQRCEASLIIPIGRVTIPTCLSERSDSLSLRSHLSKQGLTDHNLLLYSNARRLLTALISGAGLKAYLRSQQEPVGVTSNYAKLWTEFLKEIEGQGSQIKPVFAFAKAFETVSLDSSWLEGEPTILAFLAEPELDFRLVLQDFLSAGAVSGDD